MPGVEPAGLLRFTYFILFSLILPSALPFALDNLTLYRERERIRADLHDISMRGLTNIARLSEGAQMQLDSGAESHEKIAAMGERLASIERIATDANRALRGIFEVSDERYGAWADLCGYLRNCGSQLVEDADIEFQLDDARSVYDLPPSSALARACLYFVYMEALENIVRHAQATQVKVSLRGDQTGAFPALLCDIEDDGVGFDPGVKKDGHFGLPGMTKRIEELGGELTIKSTARQGTCVSFRLPVTPNIPPMGEG
jgi:signal transduction histidine kinase